MGSYTKNLFKKNRVKTKIHTSVNDEEDDNIIRIKSCAIIRNDELISGPFKSHSEVRRYLGDEDPYTEKKTDEHGFMTSGNVFVNRRAATQVAFNAGQTRVCERELLSSDIDKW